MNQKQILFCEEYIKSGNATEAAKIAGYSQRTARSIGQRLLTFVDVQEYISIRNDEMKTKNTASVEEIRAYWTAIMRDEDSKVIDRIRASELLGKSYGMFLERYAENSKDSNAGQVVIYIPDNGRD